MHKLLRHRVLVGLGLALAILALLAGAGCAGWPWERGRPSLTPTARPTLTPEPLVPTRTLAATSAHRSPAAAQKPTQSAAPPASASQSTAPAPSATAHPRATSDPTKPSIPVGTGASEVPLPHGRERFGAGVVLTLGPISEYPIEDTGLGIGWYLNWAVRVSPAHPAGADFWQMVQISEGGYRPDAATIGAAAAANPGSFWIVGNEPDVIWQNNTTPERYAELYHELYHLLKTADPTCWVVIGGVSQPTPLRLGYLERVLSTYRTRYGESMPVDVWNVHGFILREERGSWGVDIPPGVGANAGVLYEIDDHDDLEIFRSQILAFRRWMADHGERDKPLVVSEYGILMPSDYGFELERVQSFMEGSFDFLLTASDGAVGYPGDGNRLVQWWCWYSLAAPQDYYPTGNLFDPATKALTPLGAAFAAYSPP